MRFHYSHYWGCWSRVLADTLDGFVELNLTPINGWHRADELLRLKEETIRYHATPRSKRDKATDCLPDDVLAAMREHLGDELTARMLAHDYLGEIGFDVVKKHQRGGGVPFAWLKKAAA